MPQEALLPCTSKEQNQEWNTLLHYQASNASYVGCSWHSSIRLSCQVVCVLFWNSSISGMEVTTAIDFPRLRWNCTEREKRLHKQHNTNLHLARGEKRPFLSESWCNRPIYARLKLQMADATPCSFGQSEEKCGILHWVVRAGYRTQKSSRRTGSKNRAVLLRSMGKERHWQSKLELSTSGRKVKKP